MCAVIARFEVAKSGDVEKLESFLQKLPRSSVAKACGEKKKKGVRGSFSGFDLCVTSQKGKLRTTSSCQN